MEKSDKSSSRSTSTSVSKGKTFEDEKKSLIAELKLLKILPKIENVDCDYWRACLSFL